MMEEAEAPVTPSMPSDDISKDPDYKPSKYYTCALLLSIEDLIHHRGFFFGGGEGHEKSAQIKNFLSIIGSTNRHDKPQ